MIDELSTRSEEFRVRWVAHNVLFHRSGVRRFHHQLVGDLTLAYEDLELPADLGQTILVFTAEPNSSSRTALDRLASWVSTHDPLSPVEPQKGLDPHAIPQPETHNKTNDAT
ncbi:MAG TPA: hypothetical protein VGS01_08980 [Candidatus Limnocylindria bacterium]|jgi:hypothetical protein|nr:hypothetical protein [Candidatus Limnocylindria bacterium]